MSWTLGIDTSSTFLSIGLFQGTVPQLSINRFVKNAHSEHITTAIKSLLTMANITVSDISQAAIVVGPGSFTGLRISIAFLKGLFSTDDTKILPLSTLETVAFSWPGNGMISVAFDARQDSVFAATFIKDGNEISRVSDDSKIDIADFLEISQSSDLVIFDTAGNPNSPLVAGLANRPSILLEKAHLSTGLAAAQLATVREYSSEWTTAINVFPNYMQESYAERMKKA